MDIDKELWDIQQSLLSSPYNTQEEKDFFEQHISIIRVTKGSFLLKQGQHITSSFHLFKGCVREYYVKDGEEKTVGFYTVGDNLTDDGNKLNRIPSAVNWECVADCIVSDFTAEVEKEMYRRFPRLESLCRIEIEKSYSRYKKQLQTFIAASPVERYESLIESKPEVFQLVPLYHIASYLGVTPESLSRIRKRIQFS